MPAALREDLVASALTFLKNDKVQASPLARRVAFLESKGLTNEEIEEALARASGASSGAKPAAVTTAAPPAPVVPVPAPPAPVSLMERATSTNWKDAFIGVVVAGGVGYALLNAFQTYVLPSLNWPSTTQLEAEKAALEAKLRETTERLATVHEQASTMLTKLETQSTEVNTSVQAIHDTLKALDRSERDHENEMKGLREELEKLKGLVPKAIEKSKDDQRAALTDLQNEIKSLKGLLLNRRAAAPGSPAPSMFSTTATSSPPFANALASRNAPTTANGTIEPAPTSSSAAATTSSPAKPTIPAWQMATPSTPTTTNGIADSSTAEGTEDASTAASATISTVTAPVPNTAITAADGDNDTSFDTM